MEVLNLEYCGKEVVVIRPDKPNGKWIWKTEFLYAFDAAERRLTELGYTRVYYRISDMYGSYRAIRMMHDFRKYIVEKFDLEEKCILFGFSRGGLYAFNFALFYPEYVEKMYLDAPVLDFRTWPPRGPQRDQLCEVYSINEEALMTFKGNPIENMPELFSHGIPLMLVAGDSDEIVPFDKNSEKMINYCRENGIKITYVVKPGCAHHPHSLDDVTPIVDFVISEGEG